ncbi:unnamed protein product [Amoebophrya sp. A25]|nr:unnamed protein product [Amoebophrya sp. A25]|eukprot:GSA25T00024239001.1
MIAPRTSEAWRYYATLHLRPLTMSSKPSRILASPRTALCTTRSASSSSTPGKRNKAPSKGIVIKNRAAMSDTATMNTGALLEAMESLVGEEYSEPNDKEEQKDMKKMKIKLGQTFQLLDRYLVRAAALLPSFSAIELAKFLLDVGTLVGKMKTTCLLTDKAFVPVTAPFVFLEELSLYVQDETNFPKVNDAILVLKAISRLEVEFLFSSRTNSSGDVPLDNNMLQPLYDHIGDQLDAMTGPDAAQVLEASVELLSSGEPCLKDDDSHGILEDDTSRTVVDIALLRALVERVCDHTERSLNFASRRGLPEHESDLTSSSSFVAAKMPQTSTSLLSCDHDQVNRMVGAVTKLREHNLQGDFLASRLLLNVARVTTRLGRNKRMAPGTTIKRLKILAEQFQLPLALPLVVHGANHRYLPLLPCTLAGQLSNVASDLSMAQMQIALEDLARLLSVLSKSQACDADAFAVVLCLGHTLDPFLSTMMRRLHGSSTRTSPRSNPEYETPRSSQCLLYSGIEPYLKNSAVFPIFTRVFAETTSKTRNQIC